MKKLCFYLHHIVLMSKTNTIRLVLTSLGIFVSVFIYACGLILAESYYHTKFAVSDEMSSNALVMENAGVPDRVLEVLYGTDCDILVDRVTLTEINLLDTTYSKGNKLFLNAYIHGVSQIGPIRPFMVQEKCYVCETGLIKGRLINERDIINRGRVIVINETTAKLLFPMEEPLGQKVVWDFAGEVIYKWNEEEQKADKIRKHIELEVVGIVADNYQDRLNLNEIRAKYDKDNEFISAVTNAYIPQTTLDDLNERFREYICIRAGEGAKVEDINRYITGIAKKDLSHLILTRESEKDRIGQSYSSLRRDMNLVAFVICLFSGIAIMSTTFFAVKERVPEIGIRKAFGAGTPDIVFQILFEIVTIAILMSVFATGMAYLGCCMVSRFLYSRSYIVFDIYISNLRLLLPIAVGVLEAAVSALIPAVYGARIVVTDAIRFE